MIAPIDDSASTHPRLILAHSDPTYAAMAARLFRRVGWDVHEANQGAEARRLALLLHPKMVVLDTELPEDSGWLTCDKLTRQLPRLRVVLVGRDRGTNNCNLAAFVGAFALVARTDGMTALLEAAGAEVPVAG